jgi:hypothetical protein
MTMVNRLAIKLPFCEFMCDLAHTVPAGIVRLSCVEQNQPETRCCITQPRPYSAIGSAPRLGKSSANEMALKVEGAVYGGVHADDALGGSS